MGAQGRALLDYGDYWPVSRREVHASSVGPVVSALTEDRFRRAATAAFLLSGGVFGHDREDTDD